MVGGALALLIAFFVGGAAVRLGPALGFVDRPDHFLKPHRGTPVPLGGVAIFVAVHVGLLIADRFDVGLFAASAILLVLGLVDDRLGLPPRFRLAVTAFAGIVLGVVADLPGDGDGMTVALCVVLVVVAVNAVNLFDGLDGLAGATALVTALGIAGLALSRDAEVIYPLVVAAAIVGFLVWNWSPARMFLGDNGAYVVALLLVYGFFRATPDGGETPVVVAATLLGMFAVDLVVTLIRRRLAGRPLFEGDRSHVYDQLRDRGWSVPLVSASAGFAQAVFASVVIALDRLWSPWTSAIAIGGFFVLVVTLLAAGGFLHPGTNRSADQ